MLNESSTMEISPPIPAAGVEHSIPSLSSSLSNNGAARKWTRKLTPLERKERDRQRKKEQALRRRQAEQDRWDQAKLLEQAKSYSSVWHAHERQEEELLLLRLDRDAVDAQRAHPAGAGYAFQPAGTSDVRLESEALTPVFLSYSHALSPPSHDAAAAFRQLITKSTSGSASRALRAAPEAAFWHPACHGYAMARDDDCTRVSPVFFRSGFAKISLKQVANEIRERAQRTIDSDASSSEEEEEEEKEGGEASRQRASLHQCSTESERRRLGDIRDRVRGMASSDAAGNAAHRRAPCLICRQLDEATAGCPGCFSFSETRYREVEASAATQRLRTPKTRQQEAQDRQDRHAALFLRKQLLVPPLLLPRRHDARGRDLADGGSGAGGAPAAPLASVDGSRSGDAETEYYTHVLPDVHAIRKHRAISQQFVTLHVKSLPVGSILTLRVDVEATIAAVYELFRANSELPNRPVHLLLPTARGVLPLREQVAAATDTRMGVVHGELRVHDVNLQPSAATASPQTASTGGEYLLFAVAVLSASSTPQLVGHYVAQNFHLARDDLRLALLEAAELLPARVDRDACQLRLVPRVRDLQAAGRADRARAAAERREEREQLLRAAHLEAKLARVERKRLERRQRRRAAGGADADAEAEAEASAAAPSKVRRAAALLELACEPRDAAQRLDKLWQLAQRLEEWKICKGGRLVDAARTALTARLVQRLEAEAAAAFDGVLAGGDRRGPLAFPVARLDRGASPRLALRLGARLGASAREDADFGLLLALDEDWAADDAQELAPRARGPSPAAALARDHDARRRSEAVARAADCEWRAAQAPALLVASADLPRAPFLSVRWLPLARAYARAALAAAFFRAKLDEFNALAAPLRDADASLSGKQLERWRADAEALRASLPAGSALAAAAQRALGRRGAALLQRRALQRRARRREREQELEALRELQAARELPRVSAAQALKRAFAAAEAPKVRALLEATPAERLAARAAEALGAVGDRAARLARAVKKDYAVRAL